MNAEGRARINENGRVVVPAGVRQALGISPGDELLFQVKDEEMVVTTVKQRIARAQRLVRKYIKPGVSLSDELIAERRAAARKEVK
jgi:AbrB family looped-hinge helix DNA binding protein